MFTSTSTTRIARIPALCALVSTLSAAFSAQAQEAELNQSQEPQAASYTSSYGTPGASVRWNYRKIPVCWEERLRGHRYEADLVREAVAKTWERYANIEFVGWEECYGNSEGIRISFGFGQAPHVKALGRRLDGMRDGMVLSFDDQAGVGTCRGTFEQCLSASAVHQFGQALGFSHEGPSGYGPRRECLDDVPRADAGRYGGGYFISPYERDSVMNYCSYNWNNFSLYSETDRIAAQTLYPTYPVDIQVEGRRGRVELKPGHERLGYWHADRGGAVDSDWDFGDSLTVMSFDPTTLGDVSELELVVNNNGQTPMPPGNDPDWIFVGYWDVDRGGGRDSRGNWGRWNMGLFIKLRDHAWQNSLNEIKLVASNRSRPGRDRYFRLDGYWDVARRGSRGSDGSRGKWMMSLMTNWN